MTDTTTPQSSEPRRPGRPRIHDTPADRVRAHRERKRAEAAAQTVPTTSVPADPEVAATTLIEAVPLLRKEAGEAITRLTAVAERIAAAVDVLGNDTVVDTHLRKAQTEAAKVRADADAALAAMREQLDTALTDRANADAAADAADTALEQATREHDDALQQAAMAHAEELKALADEHAATLARWKTDRETTAAEHTAQVDGLTTRLETAGRLARDAEAEVVALTTRLEQAHTDAARHAADAEQARTTAARDAAAATATITRLDTDLTAARDAATAERERTDAAREELAQTRIELAETRAHATATQERIEELRSELTAVRAELTDSRTNNRKKPAADPADSND